MNRGVLFRSNVTKGYGRSVTAIGGELALELFAIGLLPVNNPIVARIISDEYAKRLSKLGARRGILRDRDLLDLKSS